MNLKINGKEEEVNGKNLLELVDKKGLDPDKIVVEYNSRIILKEELGKVALKENDTIEIVSFVGGG